MENLFPVVMINIYLFIKEHKKNYIFSTTDINSIKYVDEFVYYVDGELFYK